MCLKRALALPSRRGTRPQCLCDVMIPWDGALPVLPGLAAEGALAFGADSSLVGNATCCRRRCNGPCKRGGRSEP